MVELKLELVLVLVLSVVNITGTHYKMIIARLTHNASQLKPIFDVLKDIVTDVNLIFKSDGLYINTTDPEKVVAIHLEITRAADYHCDSESPIFISVNIQNFYKLIRSANANHVITLEVDDQTLNVLKLTIANLTKEIISVTSLYSMDLPKQEMIMPEITFQATAIIPTSDFVRTLKDLSHGSKRITISAIQSNTSHLTFATKGDNYAYTTSISICPSEQGLHWKAFEMPKFGGQYMSKYIEKFAKPQVSKFLELSFEPLGTMHIAYTYLEVGSFSMIIAPILDD